MIVEISTEAQIDLAGIGEYIARDNPDRARSFVRELREKCEGLADFPDIHPLVERYSALGVRRRRHGSYLIFFWRRGSQVTVLRVLHGARDYAEILFE